MWEGVRGGFGAEGVVIEFPELGRVEFGGLAVGVFDGVLLQVLVRPDGGIGDQHFLRCVFGVEGLLDDVFGRRRSRLLFLYHKELTIPQPRRN